MPANSPTARQVQYFIAVAEAEGFRGAAARLGVSQPTLTNQILALEQMLGLELFERSRAGTHLTPAGRDLLPAARRVLEACQGLVDLAATLSSGPTGTYRLGVTPTLGPYLLPLVLPQLHRRYTALKFYVRERTPLELEPGLVNGDFDLILGPLPIDGERLEVVPLFREPLLLVFPSDHRLAARSRVHKRDLQGEAVLAMEEHHHNIHRQVNRVCEEIGARVLRNYEGSSLDALRQMSIMGMGITFLPALYVRSEIGRTHGLRTTKLAGDDLERTHALAWRRGSPAQSLFVELAEEIREFAASQLAEHVHVFPRTTRAPRATARNRG